MQLSTRLGLAAAATIAGGAAAFGQCEPVVIGRIDSTRPVEAIEIDDRGYLYYLANGVCIADVRDPANPQVLVSGHPIGSPYFSLHVFEDRLYVMHGDDFQWGRITIHDIAVPEAIEQVWQSSFVGYGRGAISGGALFHSFTDAPVIKMYELGRDAIDTFIGGFGLGSRSAGRFATQELVVFCSTEDGIEIIDFSDGEEPRQRSFIPYAGRNNPIRVSGSVAMSSGQDGRLHAFDVRDLDRPEVLGNFVGRGLDLVLTDGLAILIRDRITFVDRTDPANMREVGFLTITPTLPRWGVARDGVLYVAAGESIYIIDFSSCEPCRADLDESGVLDLFDFLEFQRLFMAGNVRGDFDGDGSLTVFDFLAFQNAFQAGC
ncbi:MAG: GC-type dockerin domain-anchored protein [Phycisphaerales bacterium JB060]